MTAKMVCNKCSDGHAEVIRNGWRLGHCDYCGADKKLTRQANDFGMTADHVICAADVTLTLSSN